MKLHPVLWIGICVMLFMNMYGNQKQKKDENVIQIHTQAAEQVPGNTMFQLLLISDKQDKLAQNINRKCEVIWKEPKQISQQQWEQILKDPQNLVLVNYKNIDSFTGVLKQQTQTPKAKMSFFVQDTHNHDFSSVEYMGIQVLPGLTIDASESKNKINAYMDGWLTTMFNWNRLHECL